PPPWRLPWPPAAPSRGRCRRPRRSPARPCPSACWPSLPPFVARLERAFGAEVAARCASGWHFLLLTRHARIVVAERAANLVERNIGEDAAIGEIFHMAPATQVERMIDRIAGTI